MVVNSIEYIVIFKMDSAAKNKINMIDKIKNLTSLMLNNRDNSLNKANVHILFKHEKGSTCHIISYLHYKWCNGCQN